MPKQKPKTAPTSRAERLASSYGKAATALGFAFGRMSVERTAFREAFTAGYTNALRAHGTGNLPKVGATAALLETLASFVVVIRAELRKAAA